MSTIRIQSADQTWTADHADGARVFRIGRGETADIVATGPTVSRNHAEIRALGEGWEVVDLGSSVGTWVNGQRVERADLRGTMAIGFGDQGRAFSITVTVTPAAAPPAYGQPPHAPLAAQPPSVQTPLLETTMITGGFPGFGSPGGPGLLIRRRVGTDLRFPGGIPVRIGRDPSLEVHADDAAVSRLHAVVEPRPDGWWWVDRSTSGTFVDGERVTQLKIEEPVEISLGHPTAGYELEVVPVVAAGQATASIAKRKRRRTTKIVAIAAAVVLVVGGLGTAGVIGLNAVFGDDDKDGTTATPPDDGLSDAELNRAKAAAVLLQAYDDTDQLLWSGSGSVISGDGLILTNAHVGDPNAPGQGSEEPDPAYLTVSLTTGDDDVPAEAAYRANPIVSDGYLDVAVLQINADVEGNEIDPSGLDLPEPLPIGDSDALRTGDHIVALGYPAIGNIVAQGDRPLTVTEGVVSTFQADPVIDTERGSIDSDVRLGSGNSGGPSINDDGEIVGLNTRVITAASMDAGSITQGSALIVPVNLAEAVLKIAEEGGDPDYVTPYLESMPSDPGLPTDSTVTAAGWVVEGSEGECAGTSSLDDPQRLAGVPDGTTVYAEFAVEGLPTDVPIGVDYYDMDGVRIESISDTWTLGEEAVCVPAPFTVQASTEGINAVFSVGTAGEFSADNPVIFD